MRIVSRKFHRDVPYDIAVLRVMDFTFLQPEEHTEYRLVATVNGIDYALAQTETEAEMDSIVSDILYANRVGWSDIEV